MLPKKLLALRTTCWWSLPDLNVCTANQWGPAPGKGLVTDGDPPLEPFIPPYGFYRGLFNWDDYNPPYPVQWDRIKVYFEWPTEIIIPVGEMVDHMTWSVISLVISSRPWFLVDNWRWYEQERWEYILIICMYIYIFLYTHMSIYKYLYLFPTPAKEEG